MLVETPPMVAARLTAAAIARQLGCRPKDVSDLLYLRFFDHPSVPKIGRVRTVHPSMLPTIRRMLMEQGKLPNAVADDDTAAAG